VPGPRAILYSLTQDTDLVASGARLPRATRTGWQLLTRHRGIARPPTRVPGPVERPAPLTAWQLDCKDVTTVVADPGGKRQHAIAARNVIDTGVSILLDAQVRAACTAATAPEAVVAVLRAQGLPKRSTIDGNPRFVGAASGRDFPTPFVRCLTCLGVEVDSCPPHRPEKHSFVARYHSTYDRECLRLHHPATREGAVTATAAFVQHDHQKRPNQALRRGKRPPRVAHPALTPPPALPTHVDPDAWLQTVDGRRSAHTVRHDGTVAIDGDRYSLGQTLAGQPVALRIHAADRTLPIDHRQQRLKQGHLTGPLADTLPLDADVTPMREQAQARQARNTRLIRRSRAASAVVAPPNSPGGTVWGNRAGC